jgi:hypothetical protein
MTRNKEIYNFAKEHHKDISGEVDYTDTAAFEGIIKGANWADKTMIDKACEWLDMNIIDYIVEGSREGISLEDKKQLIEDFRNAMEE